MFKRYSIRMLLFALFITPMSVSIAFIGGIVVLLFIDGFIQALAGLAVVVVTVYFVWERYLRRIVLPESLFWRYLPIAIAFAYYTVVWIIVIINSRRMYSDILFEELFIDITLPYFMPNFFFMLIDDFTPFPFMQIVVYGTAALTVALSARKRKTPSANKYMAIVLAVVCAVITGIAVWQIAIVGRNYY